MPKALLCISGLQRNIGQHFDNWKEHIIDCNDYEWTTMCSFSSKARSQKYQNEKILPWDEVCEKINELRGPPFNLLHLVDFDPYPVVDMLPSLHPDIHHWPEIGPMIFFARNEHNLNLLKIQEFDKIVIIRPDAYLTANLSLEHELMIIDRQTGGGGYFSDRDWDMGMVGDYQLVKEWLSHGCELFLAMNHTEERNPKSKHLVGYDDDPRKLFRFAEVACKMIENHLYSFAHIDKLKTSRDEVELETICW